MGNAGCCPREEWCAFYKDKEKLILSDLQIIENYNTKNVLQLQSLIRGFLFRKKFKEKGISYVKAKNLKRTNFDKEEGGVSDKKNKIKSKKSKTPNGFVEELMPGRLLSDKEVEMITLKEEVVSTEKLVGPFIIEEKEVLKYLEDYKTRLKKFQLLYETGVVYIGYMDQNWDREGYGILLMQDGSKYEGTFRDNKMWGRGRLIGQKGDYYEGDFEEDKANGFGKYVNKDGCIYIGYWSNHKQHGKGEELFADGSRYEGIYENGFKQGKGKFTWLDGSIYEGDFNKNLFEGFGVYRWRDGRVYQGEWKNNKMEGVGIFVWPDKKKYIGQYLNDKKSGYGIFFWPGGKKYEGEWLNGKQHGYGILTISQMKKFGIWKDGQKDRWIANGEGMQHFSTISSEIKILLDKLNVSNAFIHSIHSEDSSPISETSSKV